MRLTARIVFALIACLAVAASGLFAKEIRKSFRDVEVVKIKTVSGDCIVTKGGSDRVEVTVSYSYHDEEFEPEFEQHGTRLILTENFRGRNSSGRSTWRVSMPAGTDIDFSTASGDLDVSGLSSKITAGTASGDVQLRDLKGRIKVGTASGAVSAQKISGEIEFGAASGRIRVSDVSGRVDFGTASGSIDADNLDGVIEIGAASGNVTVTHAQGRFDISTASGDLVAKELKISESSEFTAASGNVRVTLAQTLKSDLRVEAASGNALLSFGGNPILGRISMTTRARGSRLKAPFAFDDEEYYEDHGVEYVTKWVRKGDGPAIEIRSASGRAELAAN